MTLSERIAHGPTPPQMPFSCAVEGCLRTAPHKADDIHGDGIRTWGARDEPPEWVLRALEHRLPARVEGGAAR